MLFILNRSLSTLVFLIVDFHRLDIVKFIVFIFDLKSHLEYFFLFGINVILKCL